MSKAALIRSLVAPGLSSADIAKLMNERGYDCTPEYVRAALKRQHTRTLRGYTESDFRYMIREALKDEHFKGVLEDEIRRVGDTRTHCRTRSAKTPSSDRTASGSRTSSL